MGKTTGWPDDDPAAPWNGRIKWTPEPNGGAHWIPYSDDLVVERRPKGYRRRGLYAVHGIVHVPNGHPDEIHTGSHPLLEAKNLDEVRAYLREHWRLNHLTPEETAHVEHAAREETARQAAADEARRRP